MTHSLRIYFSADTLSKTTREDDEGIRSWQQPGGTRPQGIPLDVDEVTIEKLGES